jgi:hypothetical protein
VVDGDLELEEGVPKRTTERAGGGGRGSGESGGVERTCNCRELKLFRRKIIYTGR